MKLFILPTKNAYHEDDEIVVMAETKEDAIRKILAANPNNKTYLEKYDITENDGDVYYNGGCDC